MDCTQVLDTSEFEDSSYRQSVLVAQLIVNNECYPIYSGSNVIGRDPEMCTVALNNMTLSKKHAVIEVHNCYSHFIYDLDSRNKTRLGKMHLKPHVRYNIPNKSQLQFGNLLAEYCVLNQGKESTPHGMVQESDDEIIPDTPVQAKSKDSLTSGSREESPTIFQMDGDSSVVDIFEDRSLHSRGTASDECNVGESEQKKENCLKPIEAAVTHGATDVSGVIQEQIAVVSENVAKTTIDYASDGDETDPEDIFFAATQKCDTISKNINEDKITVEEQNSSSNRGETIVNQNNSQNSDGQGFLDHVEQETLTKDSFIVEKQEIMPKSREKDKDKHDTIELAVEKSGNTNSTASTSDDTPKMCHFIESDDQGRIIKQMKGNNSEEMGLTSNSKCDTVEPIEDEKETVSDMDSTEEKNNSSLESKNMKDVEMDNSDSIYFAATQIIEKKSDPSENRTEVQSAPDGGEDEWSSVRGREKSPHFGVEVGSEEADAMRSRPGAERDHHEEEGSIHGETINDNNSIFDAVTQVIAPSKDEALPQANALSSIDNYKETHSELSGELKVSTSDKSHSSNAGGTSDSKSCTSTPLISVAKKQKSPLPTECASNDQNSPCLREVNSRNLPSESLQVGSAGDDRSSELLSKGDCKFHKTASEEVSSDENCGVSRTRNLNSSQSSEEECLDDSFFDAPTQVLPIGKNKKSPENVQHGVTKEVVSHCSKNRVSFAESLKYIENVDDNQVSSEDHHEGDSRLHETNSREKCTEKLSDNLTVNELGGKNLNNEVPSEEGALDDSFFNAATQVIPAEINKKSLQQTERDVNAEKKSPVQIENDVSNQQQYDDSFFYAATQIISSVGNREKDEYHNDDKERGSSLSRSSSYSSIHDAPTQAIDEMEEVLNDQQHRPKGLEDSSKTAEPSDYKMEQAGSESCQSNATNTSSGVLKAGVPSGSKDDCEAGPSFEGRQEGIDSEICQTSTVNHSSSTASKEEKVTLILPSSQALQAASEELYRGSSNTKSRININNEECSSPVLQNRSRRTLFRKINGDRGKEFIDNIKEIKQTHKSAHKTTKSTSKSKVHFEKQLQSRITEKKLSKKSEVALGASPVTDDPQQSLFPVFKRQRTSDRRKDTASSNTVSPALKKQIEKIPSKTGDISNLSLDRDKGANESTSKDLNLSSAASLNEVNDGQVLQKIVTRKPEKIPRKSSSVKIVDDTETDHKQPLMPAEMKKQGRVSRKHDKASSEANPHEVLLLLDARNRGHFSKDAFDATKDSSEGRHEKQFPSHDNKRKGRRSKKSDEGKKALSDITPENEMESDNRKPENVKKDPANTTMSSSEVDIEQQLHTSAVKEGRRISKRSNKSTKVYSDASPEKGLQSSAIKKRDQISQKSDSNKMNSSGVDFQLQFQETDIREKGRVSRKRQLPEDSRVQKERNSVAVCAQEPLSSSKKQSRMSTRKSMTEEHPERTEMVLKPVDENQLKYLHSNKRVSHQRQRSMSKNTEKEKKGSLVEEVEEVQCTRITGRKSLEEVSDKALGNVEVTDRNKIIQSHSKTKPERPSRLRKMTWKARENIEDSSSKLKRESGAAFDEKNDAEQKLEESVAHRRSVEITDSSANLGKKSNLVSTCSSDTDAGKESIQRRGRSRGKVIPFSSSNVKAENDSLLSKRRSDSTPHTSTKRRKAVIASSSSDHDDTQVAAASKQAKSQTRRKGEKAPSPEKGDAQITSSLFSSPRGRRNASQSSGAESDSQCSTPKRSSRLSQKIIYYVMFTGINCSDDDELAIKKLGGKVVGMPAECTVLVTDKVRRTFKFLCIMGQGKPVVSLDWIKKSVSSKQFLDPWNFIVKDKEAEKKYKFQLHSSLRKASAGKLLDGYAVFTTPSVQPPPSQMKDVVESCGGLFLTREPRNGIWPERCFIISTREDKQLCSKLKKTSVPIVSAEILLTGVLQQKLDIKSHALKC